jgi:hypothetical protein
MVVMVYMIRIGSLCVEDTLDESFVNLSYVKELNKNSEW